ncbi:MAG: threonylcarbamoyl-AMP synthase [Chloroflexota bacterium]
MKTLFLDGSHPDTLDIAADLLRRGELVAFPTDTVYGLGVHSQLPQAIEQLYVVKGRREEKGIPLLLADTDSLALVVTEVPEVARRLARAFWPGGLTLVLPKKPTVPAAVSREPTVAVRIPDHPLTLALIRKVGTPLATSSANRSGKPSLTTAQEVRAVFDGRIAAIIDGGETPGGVASTIVDCTTQPPRILRVGAIPVEEILPYL